MEQDLKAALKALVANEVMADRMLKTHPPERFELYHLSAADYSARLSLMPKPIEDPLPHVVFWLSYWPLAFQGTLSTQDMWREVNLDSASLLYLCEEMEDVFDAMTIRTAYAAEVQHAVLGQVQEMRASRRGIWPWRRRFQVRSCRSDGWAADIEDTPLRAPFLRAWHLVEGWPEVDEWDNRAVLFETDAVFGIWDWRHTPRVDVS